MKQIVTFGEIMGRIMPNGFLRFRQALPGLINFTFAGAEANVAASIAYMGGSASFITALIDNDITCACLSQLRSIGVDTSHTVFCNVGRFGLYYTETGANQRPSRVIYDREYSTISVTDPSAYNWDRIFHGADWFHVTGITPSLSGLAANATVEGVKKAKSFGLTVSCDLNYRSKLWQWDKSVSPEELANRTMTKILPYVDVLITNEEDASCVLGIHPADTDICNGKLDVRKYKQVASEIASMFPNLQKIATTFRQSVSASHNNWGAMLYDSQEDKSYYAPLKEGKYSPYQITDIVDRVGSGDSFAAGLIFAFNTYEHRSCERSIAFATAASCLAHSIKGDFNFNHRSEIELLMNGNESGRVVR
jgi:2-dehydro-3-deoxygluconokinase